MAKPKGENQKAVAARERKSENASQKKAALEKAKEDAKWQDNDKQLAKKTDRAADKVQILNREKNALQLIGCQIERMCAKLHILRNNNNNNNSL